MEMDLQPSTSGTGKKEKTTKRKVFQNKWLNMDIFKNWLTPHESNEKALCTACNRVLVCGKFELIRHSQSKLHIENFNKNRNINPSVLLSKLTVEDNDHINKVKRTEIKLAAFFCGTQYSF